MALPVLNEDFSSITGALAPYRRVDTQADVPVRRHYDIRSYHSTDRRVPRTQADMRRWNSWYWDGWSQRDLAEGLVLEGREFRERTVGDLGDLWAQTTLSVAVNNVTTTVNIASTTGFPVTNGFYAELGPDTTAGGDGEIVLVTAGAGTTTWTVLRGQLGTTAVAHALGVSVEYTPIEGLSMFDLDYLVLGLGNEEWPDESGVTVGKNAAWRWQAYMEVSLLSGQQRIVASAYPDDLITGFELGTYYIEVPLRDFPAQTDPAHLDLVNSYVEFTSSDTWEPGLTDALSFSQSINPVTAGGNTYLRFDRASLVNVDLSDIKKIRFRLSTSDPGQPATPTPTVGPAGSPSGTFDYKITFTSLAGESLTSATSSSVVLASQQATVGIPLGPTGTVGRKLYRRAVGVGVTFPGVTGQTTLTGAHTIPVGTLTVASTAAFTDTGRIVLREPGVKDVVLDYTGKTATTFTGVTVVTGTSGAYPNLSDVYQGTYPGGSLYPGGTSGYRLVATIANNTATSYNDNYIVTGSEPEPPTSSSFGNMTFKTQNMRMIPVDYTYSVTDIDTKRAQLVRSVPRAGVEHVTDDPAVFLATSRPKNLQQFILFNSGHIPAAANVNEFSFIARYIDPNNYLRWRLRSDTTSTRLALIKRVAGVNTTIHEQTGPALTGETDYYLVLDLLNTAMIGLVYKTKGVFLGDLVLTTSPRSIAAPTLENVRGYIGYEYLPYNYDFAIQYLRSSGAEFATFESDNFMSKQNVAGASIYPRNSAPVDMLQGMALEPTGDAVVTTNVSQGQPPASIQVDRAGAFWYGGIRSQEIAVIGDSEQTYIRGDLYPVNSAKGIWRILLFDPDGLIAWIGYIENLVANKWNSFEIPVRTQLPPSGFRIYLENNGFAPNDYTAKFYLDNWKVDHESVTWEASADNGTNWQHFYEALNDKYRGIKFSNRGRNLKVRATALTGDAWIHSYELVPRYQVPGHRS